MSRYILDCKPHEIATFLPSDIIVPLLDSDEDNYYVECGQNLVDVGDCSRNGRLVLLRIEIGRDKDAIKRHCQFVSSFQARCGGELMKILTYG